MVALPSMVSVWNAVSRGQKPARSPARWHKLRRRLRSVMAASARMPTAFPPESRHQYTATSLIEAIRADPLSFKPSGKIHCARANAEADQLIALLSRTLVAMEVGRPAEICVESADGDYVLHDDPAKSYAHQFFWSSRRRSNVILNRARLYNSPLFPAKTEAGARLFACLLGDDTTREGRAGWGAETIDKLVQNRKLDLVRRNVVFVHALIFSGRCRCRDSIRARRIARTRQGRPPARQAAHRHPSQGHGDLLRRQRARVASR